MNIHPNAIAVLIAIGAGCSFPVVHANSWHTLNYTALAGKNPNKDSVTVTWDRAPAAGIHDCIRIGG